MSKETRNTTMKAIAEAEVPVKTVNPIKPVPAKHVPTKQILAKHVPAVQVLTTFDNCVQRLPMKPIKLEECLFILQVLAAKGPLKPNTIMSKFRIKRSLMEDCLELLTNQNLIIEEIGYSNKLICYITEDGNKVLKFFKLDVPTKTPCSFQF